MQVWSLVITSALCGFMLGIIIMVATTPDPAPQPIPSEICK